MKQWMKDRFLYYIAGVLLVLAYSLLWFLDTPAGVQLLRYVGGAILVVGIVLIFLPRIAFRSKGKPEKGKDWTETTIRNLRCC
jgi:Na+/melibiose symporter-like transporter